MGRLVPFRAPPMRPRPFIPPAVRVPDLAVPYALQSSPELVTMTLASPTVPLSPEGARELARDLFRFATHAEQLGRGKR